MPYTYKIDERKVIINTETKKILLGFNQVLISNKLDKSQQKPGIDQTRKGLWSFINKAERLLDFTASATECLLDRIEVKLDPASMLLLEEYIIYLNALFKEDKVKSDEIVCYEISNYRVLTREICIRLCTDALSSNMQTEHDGDVLLTALEDFITSLKQHRKLFREGYFSPRLTNVARSFATDHNIWLGYMKQMVRAVKALHENENAVTATLTYLKEAQFTIIRQIAAELLTEPDQKKIKPARFHPSMLLETFKRVEEIQLKKLEQSNIQENINLLIEYRRSGLVISNNLELVEQRKRLIVRSINTNAASVLLTKYTKREHVAGLYSLLRKTMVLQAIAEQIDMLNSTTGWIAIITGALKVDAFARLLQEHGNACERILSVDRDAAIFNYAQIGDALYYNNATSGYNLKSLAINSSTQLESLARPETIERLFKLIGSTIARLYELQEQLPETEVKIIDKSICKKFLAYLEPSKSAAAIPFREQTVDRFIQEPSSVSASLIQDSSNASADHQSGLSLSQLEGTKRILETMATQIAKR